MQQLWHPWVGLPLGGEQQAILERLSTDHTRYMRQELCGWLWTIDNRYSTLKLKVGVDLSNSAGCQHDILRFLGNSGSMLPFTSTNGKLVEGTYIPVKGLTPCTVNISKQKVITLPARSALAPPRGRSP